MPPHGRMCGLGPGRRLLVPLSALFPLLLLLLAPVPGRTSVRGAAAQACDMVGRPASDGRSPEQQRSGETAVVSWTVPETLGRTPPARAFHAIEVFGPWLFLFGGSNAGGVPLNDLWTLDLRTFEWQEATPIGTARPAPRKGFSASRVGDLWYIFGGWDFVHWPFQPLSHGCLDFRTVDAAGVEVSVPRTCTPPVASTQGCVRYFGDLWVLNTTAMSWSRVVTQGTPPSPRFGTSAVTVGTRIYFFGGAYWNVTAQDFADSADLWYLETATNPPAWVWLAPADVGDGTPRPRSGAGMGASESGEWLFVLNGEVHEPSLLDVRVSDMWVYDNNSWHAVLPDYPMSYWQSVVRIADEQYIFGGRCNGPLFNTLKKFPSSGSAGALTRGDWVTPLVLGTPPSPRYQHASARWGRTMVVFGGYIDQNRYDPDLKMWPFCDPLNVTSNVSGVYVPTDGRVYDVTDTLAIVDTVVCPSACNWRGVCTDAAADACACFPTWPSSPQCEEYSCTPGTKKITLLGGIPQCEDCPLSTFNRDGSGRCDDCPEGGVCPGGSTVLAERGYWLDPTHDTEPRFYRCPEQYCCPDGWCNSSNPCGPHHVGFMCGDCETGFAEWDGFCEDCTRLGPSRVVWTVLIIGLLTVSLLLFIPRNRSSSLLRITIFFYQVCVMIYTADSINFLHLVNFEVDILVVLDPNNKCISNVGPLGKVFFNFATPLLLYAEFLIVCGILVAYGRLRTAVPTLAAAEARVLPRALRTRNWHSAIVCGLVDLVLLSFMPLVRPALDLLACRRVGDRLVLASAPSVVCWRGAHIPAALFGLLVIAAFGGALPVVIGLFVRRLARRKDIRGDDSIRDRFGVLYLPFDVAFPWYMGVELFERALVVTCISLLAVDAFWKRAGALLVLGGVLFHHQVRHPYNNALDNTFKSLSLILLLFVAMLGASTVLTSRRDVLVGSEVLQVIVCTLPAMVAVVAQGLDLGIRRSPKHFGAVARLLRSVGSHFGKVHANDVAEIAETDLTVCTGLKTSASVPGNFVLSESSVLPSSAEPSHLTPSLPDIPAVAPVVWPEGLPPPGAAADPSSSSPPLRSPSFSSPSPKPDGRRDD